MDTLTKFYEQSGDVLSSTPMKLAIIVIIIVLAKRFGMIFISRAIRKGISPDLYASKDAERQREDTLISILSAIVGIGLWVMGAMLILTQLGVEIGPLLAGVSFAGVAIGFGAQSLVKDVVSGLFIILENQYRVDDVVTIADTTGVVEDISLRQTTLRDLDGNKHFVPNGSIDVATNMTMDYSSLHMNIGVSYDSDIDKVEKVINDIGQAMAKDKKLAKKIIEPPKFMRVNNFGASEVEIKIHGNVKPGTQWSMAGELRRRLKKEFDKHGIEIPFPQMVIHETD